MLFRSGSLMNYAHCGVYLMVALFGNPNSVKCIGNRTAAGVDGQGIIMCKYDEMDSVIQYSSICNSNIQSEIQGEKGSILIENISGGTILKIKYNDGSEEVIYKGIDKSEMYYGINEFVKLLLSKELESTINTYRNTQVTMEIVDESRKQIGLVYPQDKMSALKGKNISHK